MSYKVEIDSDLEAVIPQFISNRLKDVDALKKAHQEASYEAIRFIGHSLKGVGSGYGFDRVTELGRALEITAEKQESEKIAELIAMLEDFLNNVEMTFVDE